MSLPPLNTDPDRVAEDKGPYVIGTITAVAALSTSFAIARIYVRAWIKRTMQFDDYIVILCSICSWLSVGLSIGAINSGSGRHIDTLQQHQIEGAIKFTLIGYVPGIQSFVLPKFAVVALLIRLLRPSRFHVFVLWFMCGFCFVTMAISISIAFAQCKPSNSQWDFSIVPDYCWSKWILVHYSQAACAWSAFVDGYLAVYPGVVLFKLQLPRRKKIALSIALGIGSISTIVALYKLSVLWTLASQDFTYDGCDLTIWTIVEGSVLIIAACIPLLQPLVDGFGIFQKLSKNRSSGKAYNYPGSAASAGKGYDNIEQSKNKERIRKARRDFEMESVLATKNHDKDVASNGSQERILEEGNTLHLGIVREDTPSDHRGASPPQMPGRIYRTEEVHISYDDRDANRPNQPSYQGTGWH